MYICIYMFVNNFLAPIQVIPLATGDEVIKFRKVKIKGQGRRGKYALYWTILVTKIDTID